MGLKLRYTDRTIGLQNRPGDQILMNLIVLMPSQLPVVIFKSREQRANGLISTKADFNPRLTFEPDRNSGVILPHRFQ